MTKSSNVKTGGAVQTYILVDDMNPSEAVATGQDEAVCGDCPHRPKTGMGSCYVNIVQGPRAVMDAYKRGKYPTLSRKAAAAAMAGKYVRLGSYGDGAAIPLAVWENLLSKADSWTGYTHQWRNEFADGFQKWCMASIETAEQRADAHAKGYRTFRVRSPDEPKEAGEIVCPASEEAGKRLTCETCKACGGGAPPKVDVVIEVHGLPYKKTRYGDRNGRIPLETF